MSEIQAECKVCKADLDSEWRVSDRGTLYLVVESCGGCLDKIDETAYATGYADGKVAGRDEASS